ncbi:MCE family protein [Mycobacterium sp. CVI_P3]|uniref:MCE family protein n=1 Tax=Mycobacterium pinniadriaticum TaxID=2994102 RepID=A0ABT3SF55_9MYCO|nr:MCE family protein [Mycobacterium pinniadriaticum]MCX2931780.1 MCE family protein [Mycobacterium pinniadriaticum]MCX2938145.1 MCE family protein [Mycobacterium pinniadriaticum]
MESRRDKRVHQGWWTLILLMALAAMVFLTYAMFVGTFTSFVPVTLTSDRAGLVMEPGGKVKMRGVQVGRVGSITVGGAPVTLRLEIEPDQLKYIPANVQAQIRATTAFGAKYVDLIYPSDPSPQRLSAGMVIQSRNVSTEVNTVFQNLTGVLAQVDPAKLNSVLSAVAVGLRGEGQAIGEAITDGNQVLTELNPRADTFRRDWRALKGFSDTYSAAAKSIVATLDAASTTSATITSNASNLDALLLSVIGLSNDGINLLGPNKDNLVKAINVLEPTTRLLMKYNPQLTCMLVGGKKVLDDGFGDIAGGANGKSLILDTALLFGDDLYQFPANLPIVGAKGGPGGAPSCGSLPDVSKNFPQRYLITNTGWGTGMDVRPNPGIGFPGYANFFPVTRGAPQPPSVRYQGGPAPGPVPYPGGPPYGAQQYAPDGTPLYPDLPPAPPPGAPREPGPPPPGTEPFIVQNPAVLAPTPTPPQPPVLVPSP